MYSSQTALNNFCTALLAEDESETITPTVHQAATNKDQEASVALAVHVQTAADPDNARTLAAGVALMPFAADDDDAAFGKLKSGSRKSADKVDPDWTKVRESEEYGAPILKVPSLISEGAAPEDPSQFPLKLTKVLATLEDGGGGFSLAGPKGGIIDASRNISWTYRCKSCNAFGCPFQVKVMWRNLHNDLIMKYSKGWEHVHSGECQLSRGLPAPMKEIILDIIKKQPSIKLKTLKNELTETHNFSMDEWGKKVGDFFYNNRQANKTASTGVSSFGTVAEFVESNGLYDMIKAHKPHSKDALGGNVYHPYSHVCGVLFHDCDVANNTVLVGFGTMASIRTLFAQQLLGFTDGQIHIDFTFKVLQEQIPIWIMTVADIQQHGHLVAFGPASEETEGMCTKIASSVRDVAELLMDDILVAIDNPENKWASTALVKIKFAGPQMNRPKHLECTEVDFIKELCNRSTQVLTLPCIDDIDVPESGIVSFYLDGKERCYPVYQIMEEDGMGSGKFIIGKLEVNFSLADAVEALSNGLKNAFPRCMLTEYSGIDAKMCYVHVWMAIEKWLNKAENKFKGSFDSHKAKVSELLTDIAYLHEIAFPALLQPAMAKFCTKWQQYHPRFVTYFKREWMNRKWSRCFGLPGEPSDNNTLESFNRVVKSESMFCSTSSLAQALPTFLLVGARTSRDKCSGLFPSAPEETKKLWMAAQKLVKDGWDKTGYELTLDGAAVYVMPTSKGLAIPAADNPKEYVTNLAKDFTCVLTNPSSNAKFLSMDFDEAMKIMFSFWVLKEIKVGEHKAWRGLHSAGIFFTCSCPAFMHYHCCKHVLAMSITRKNAVVPPKWSTATAGKAKAPAGPKVHKRSHCLQID